jgi:hypothetical protein
MQPARLTAIVPVLDIEFATAVQGGHGEWYDFAEMIAVAQRASPGHIGIFPLLLDPGAISETILGRIFGSFQHIGAPPAGGAAEPMSDLLARDLAQAIAQLADDAAGSRLTVFISHTKRTGPDGEPDTSQLVNQVRAIIGDTRLDDFFDASDLQPGRDWSADLHSAAGKSALLAIRTDLYASRAWCQREMLIAKCHGMPIVILDALGDGEERGSFLMDHVPRVPVRRSGEGWSISDIRRGLNLLVDDCLKRALWRHQQQLAAGRAELEVSWWAPHAPEPATLAAWLEEQRSAGRLKRSPALRIMHPDPPLGEDELSVLHQIVRLDGRYGHLDIMTPRLLAARGG